MINILIADDNIYFAKILMNTINNEICSDIKVTHIAVDGKETLDIIKNNKIDVILLDLKMPIYDGLYILEKLKKEQFNRYNQSIIVISGEREMLYKANNQSYVYCTLDKLCSISNIIDKIKELVQYKEQEKKENQIESKIIEQLQYLNYNLSHKGTKYLIKTIQYIVLNPNKELDNLEGDIYPIIARFCNNSVHNIKCNINRATTAMYYECDSSRLQKYFCFNEDYKPKAKIVINTIVRKIS